jgi:hypothetical protein
VPPGIRGFRTGPTTPAELDRLLADAVALDPLSDELSGVRSRQVPSLGLWLRVLAALGFAPARAR